MIDHGPIPLDPPGQRVSFGQNGEDVRLWRAFEGIEDGFYVEVGGWDPVIDSISRSFYGRGWSGVVVEPVAEYAEEFTRRRPRDRVFPVLAGREEGRVAFHVFPRTGLSTTVDEHAANHKQLGFEESKVREVAVRPLSSCLEEVGSPTIHFMIIDVEGAESQVLEGLDLRRHRPWVLVIESTLPMSHDVSHAEWEPGLLALDYSFAAFDGVNRFYVAREHAELAGHVETPPNALDAYLTRLEWMLLDERAEWESMRAAQALEIDECRAELVTRTAAAADLATRLEVLQAAFDECRMELGGRTAAAADLATRLEVLQAAFDECRAELDMRTANAADLGTRLEVLQAAFEVVVTSRSWRLTRPLRALRGKRP